VAGGYDDQRFAQRAAATVLAGVAVLGVLAAGPALRESAPPPDVVAVDPGAKVAIVGGGHVAKVEPDRLAPFRGLSSWIDTYDDQLTPEQQVAAAVDGGVQILFVQSARQSTEGLLHDADRLARTIEVAHDHGISVVLWTIPELVDLDRDLAQAAAAIDLVTPRGDRADGFGLDIELDDVPFSLIRNRRLLALSDEIRAHAGWRYPMAAIVLPPRQLEINTRWWPNFPYAELADRYDVLVPMSYSSYRGTDAEITYTWNRDNVVLTRELAGDPELPVHLAGGIADRLPAVEAFVRAAADSGAIGGGLYDLHTTRPEAWATLRALRGG
jgi:hypothetical protein